MIKKICFLALLVGIGTGCFCQASLTDALKLSKMLDENKHFPATKKDSVLSILNKYVGGEITIPNSFSNKSKSPFISKYFDKDNTFDDNFNNKGIGSLVSSIGGLDVTNIADGFAKFIVKRTKQELSISFFEKFKKELQKYPDLRTVFPNTYNLLLAIDQQIYNYSNYINNLREAFRSDLQTIDEHLPGIIDNHPAFFSRKNNFELGLALRTGCYVAGGVKHEVHPGDILNGYPVSMITQNAPASDTPKLNMLKGGIQFLQLVSESLKETDTSKHSYWIGLDNIRQLVNDKDAFNIYIGLLLQVANIKYDKIKFNETENFFNMLNKEEYAAAFDTAYPAYKQYILNFGTKVNEINQMIKDYEKPAGDSIKVEQYARYFKATAQFIQYCVQVSTLPYINKIKGLKNIDNATKKYFDITYETADLATAIVRKRYPEAVNHLLVIYDKTVAAPSQPSAIYKNSDEEKIALANHIITERIANPNSTAADVMKTFPADSVVANIKKITLSNKEKIQFAELFDSLMKANPNIDINAVISNLPGDIKNKMTGVLKTAAADNQTADATNSSNILAAFAKYGAFMCNMINAKSSNDVEQAIESVALPVGSARIKRETPVNVAINAYAGLFYGHESIRGVKDNLVFNSYGLTAPIGISASIGTKRGWSHSLFISIVDIGAIAAFRFADDTTAQVPTIQLKNIISPGLFYSLGIPRSPVSVNIGAQVGPNLRKVTSKTNDYSDKTYMRYSFAICVDLPLLNLYTKSK